MADPFSTDFARMFEQMKVPGVDMESIIASQRKNLEALTKANQLALEGMQKVMQRQAEAVRAFATEFADMAKGVAADQGSPTDKVARSTDLVKASFEKTLNHMRELSETIAKSNTQAAEVLSSRVSEGLSELKDAMHKAKPHG
ncbi:phasin family protein [Roseiterribacter gracilis]|uniref:Phasin n=1 Tax=Roseiterribacter gracilis TaxID=2812848 RepID=A0A8S8XC63_9PROT|nr:phasin [Rhodospirillales bacterium TMPK1]